MSAKRTPTPAPRRRTTAASPATPPAASAAHAPDDEEVSASFTEELLSRLAPESDAERAAFSAQCSPDFADELGRATTAVDVQRDARRALKRGERMLTTYGALITNYTLRRLVFLAVRMHELDVVLDGQTQGRSAQGISKAKRVAADKRLRASRMNLVHSLNEVVEGNDDYSVRLAATRGGLTDEAGLVAASRKAIALAEELIANPASPWPVLTREHGLTAAAVDQVRRDANALAAFVAHTDDNHHAGDSPPVNRAEGYVLFELRKLRRALDRAHSGNKLVERYVPIPALRHVLGLGDASAPDAAQPAAPPAAPAPKGN